MSRSCEMPEGRARFSLLACTTNTMAVARHNAQLLHLQLRWWPSWSRCLPMCKYVQSPVPDETVLHLAKIKSQRLSVCLSFV